jgi:hypothetical protein
MLYVAFGFTVNELKGFKDFNLALGMLLATLNAADSAQNCQNLPNSTQRGNFEMPPKIEILVFFNPYRTKCPYSGQTGFG